MLIPFPVSATPKNTVWYLVTVGGYESITYPDGSISVEMVMDSFKVEIEDSYLGCNDRPQIFKEAEIRFPEKFVYDYIPCNPPVDEF